MSDYLIGIDLGSYKVCAAAGKINNNGELQISGITSVNCSGIKEGIVVDIDSAAQSIKSCCESLERIIDTNISEARISFPSRICEIVPNKGVIAVSSEDRQIKENDIRRVIKAVKIITVPENMEIIGVIPKEYIIDGLDTVKDPLGKNASRLQLDAYVILAKSTAVSNIFKSINKAGIKLNGIVFQPVAAAKAALDLAEMEIGTALIDIGEESSDISIFKHGNLVYTGNVKIGGNSITNDISVCLKLPYSEAEMLKIKYGKLGNYHKIDSKINVNASYGNIVEIDHNLLLEIIEARIEEIFELIKRKLKKSGHYDEVSGIVLIGGGIALFNGVCGFSSKILEKSVRIGCPKYVGAANPSYVSAAGILMDSEIPYNERKKVTKNMTTNEKSTDWRQIVSKEDVVNNRNFVSRIKDFFTEFF